LNDCICDLAWSRLVVEPAELSEIDVDREVFQNFFRLLPNDFPRGKAGMKMNEMKNICVV